MPSYTAESREEGRARLPIGARTDNWWTAPLSFAIVFGLFVVYVTYRMFENAHYEVHASGLLSPLYSPLLPFKFEVNLPLLGQKMISPAIYILIVPMSFRMSCYYYRKAYYRALFQDPLACGVAEPMAKSRMRYTGERALPFVALNFHRYAFYAAAIFIFILGYDVLLAFRIEDASGVPHFGIGVGTLIFIVNWVLLTGYTFGCHSWRHLIGGGTDCYSCTAISRTRYGLWQKFSLLNSKHAQWAWLSMISVGIADLYVNLVSRGTIPDLHILF